MKRTNTARKYTGTSQHRPDRLKARKLQAEARQKTYDGMSPQAKLQDLDEELGVGIGAKKQRAKLNALLEGKKAE